MEVHIQYKMVWNFKDKPELPNSVMDIYYFQSPHKQILESFRARVVKVHDGDTIRVKWVDRDFDFPVRFLGTNAPEMSEPRGAESRDWLSARILGENVDILIDKKNRVGKWGRILGKVQFGGRILGDEMISLGLSTSFENRNEGQFPNINKILGVKKWF